MGIETAVALGAAAIGAYGARREGRATRRAARKTEAQAQEREQSILQDEASTRRNRQRSALQPSPTLFDLLRGPGG
jgi:hypothetical protein